MKAKDPNPSQRVYREMTVALIRERQDIEDVELAFSESARFYRVLRRNPKFEDIVRELREAKKHQRPVRVLLDFPKGDVIEDVQP